MATADLTAQRLRDLLHYNPETGIFTARADFVGKGCKRRAGDAVGSKHNRGYWQIRLAHKRFLADRLAWLYMTVACPNQAIDHINGVKADNRWVNLRDVSQFVNMQNLKRGMGNSASGLLGVAWAARDAKWIAQINANGKHYHIGSYSTKEDAHIAYLSEKKRLHTPPTAR
jgi:hypothetical protein